MADLIAFGSSVLMTSIIDLNSPEMAVKSALVSFLVSADYFFYCVGFCFFNVGFLASSFCLLTLASDIYFSFSCNDCSSFKIAL